MSTEWNEENIREHMFTDVEMSDSGERWSKHKLGGFCPLRHHPFVSDRGGEYRHMRLIPKPTKRLMKPIELAGRWLDFSTDGMSLVCGFDDGEVTTSHDSFEVEKLNRHHYGCIGWRDTPTSELNTSFEVDE